MAKMFEVNTISGSFVMAKMAGTLSTAKTMSEISTKISATKSGVAMRTPLWWVKNFWPSRFGLTGRNFFKSLKTGFFSGSTGFSGARSTLMPVTMRNTPNRMTTQ